MTNNAIIDNSALRALYLLNQVPMLQLIYDQVLIPKEVEKEFLSISDISQQQARFVFLMQFYKDHSSWFLPCNQYDQAIMLILQTLPKMDKGESEVLSQNACLGCVHQVIIDEKIARQFAQQQAYRMCGTLSILARLELQFSCIDYQTAVDALVVNFGVFYSKAIIKQAYQTIKKELGL